MNFATFERAQVAAFAYGQARHTGSIDCIRAVCFILRNRVKSGWGGGSWLNLIDGAWQVRAHKWEWGIQREDGSSVPNNDSAIIGPVPIEVAAGHPGTDRLLQMIVRDIDDIYLGQEPYDDRVAQVCVGREDSIGESLALKTTLGYKNWKPALYYSFLNREVRPWFKENIIQRPLEHPQVSTIGGSMMLYR